jgi:hypothetical protein
MVHQGHTLHAFQQAGVATRRAHQPEALAVEAGGMPGGAQVLVAAQPDARRDADGLGRVPGLDRVMGHPGRPLDRDAEHAQRLEVLGRHALRVPALAPLGAAVVARNADARVLNHPQVRPPAPQA